MFDSTMFVEPGACLDARDLDLGLPLDHICRHEGCKRSELHACHAVRRREGACRTRSTRHALMPWRAQCPSVLRESVLGAVSGHVPRNFQAIRNLVWNDYGHCLDRSVYRHLGKLTKDGLVARMGFPHHPRVYAYLLPDSKLLADPGSVYEQVMMLYPEDFGRMAA